MSSNITQNNFSFSVDSSGQSLAVFLHTLRFGSNCIQIYLGQQFSAEFNNFSVAIPDRTNNKKIHATKGIAS